MEECYKLLVTTDNNGVKKSMAVMYQLCAECLVAVEEDFERWKKEPKVVELHLFRIDYRGLNELRRWFRK